MEVRFRISKKLAPLSFVFLTSCTGVGQLSIQQERNQYNDVIHDTGTEQLLVNIVRAHNYESPSFFDVSEVDQTKTLQGNLQGGSSNIGAVVPLGALSSTLTATDSPIIKYMPPTSAAYIQQVIQPIDLASFAHFKNSNVPIEPYLRFAFDRLTPAYADFFRASAIISALDSFGAIRIDATSNDLIMIVLTPDGLIPSDAPCLNYRPANTVVADLWRQLTQIFNQPDSARVITLRTPSSKSRAGQVALARSALGALRMAERDEGPDVLFTDRSHAQEIRAENGIDEDENEAGDKDGYAKNGSRTDCLKGYDIEFYYLPERDSSPRKKWTEHFNLLKPSVLSLDTRRQLFRSLGHKRALIVIEDSETRPSDAYVSVARNGHWYSISNRDRVSKKNFALLGNLLLIQARPPSSGPTPTVIAQPITR